ncbi:MAG: pimeloyl-ACP methyl ester carboxylesterase [Flavobacteriales bacterium]|jgi:pimeloyl-ACP methyl ester carboxylesterase
MIPEIQKEGKFEYLERGEGTPIILLHGLMGALSNFESLIAHLSSNGYRVFIPLLPIFELPLLKTSAKGMAKFLTEFVIHKGLDKFHLLGNSLGGHVALIYTNKFPENVITMTLTGSSGLYESAMGDTFPRREDKNYIREKTQAVFYDPAVATDELVDEVYDMVNSREKVVRILAIAKSAIRHNMSKDLPSMNVPTCLIWGKNDGVTPPDVANEFHKLLPNSELNWIDECGHAAMMEQPKEFNKIVGDWLKRHS